MNIKYRSAVILVKDIKTTRKFYEDLLEQKVTLDHGECVDFIGGFSIWQIDHANNIMFENPSDRIEIESKSNNLELYFETDNVEDVFNKALDSKAQFVHNIIEEPWGQRVFRIYDPDMNIIEVGEPMEAVIKRFIEVGLNAEEVSKRASMPIEIVQKVAENI